MSKDKQIEEMAKCCTYYHNGECCADATNICECDLMCEMFGVFANIEKEGYRKQIEGEWIYRIDDLFPAESTQECSICHEHELITLGNDNFCPNCGAKMRKEDGGGNERHNERQND